MLPRSKPAYLASFPRTADHRTLHRCLRRDLPHHAVARSAGGGCAVEIAVPVDDDVAVRIGAVRAAEVMQVGVDPAAAGKRQLEHRTEAIGAVLHRGAVEISGAV